MAIMLLIANDRLTVEKARIKKGRLIATINTDKGIVDSSAEIRAIPMAPPSIKELGIRKLSKPKLADNTPSMTEKASLVK